MPLYRITSASAAPLSTWGRSIHEAATWYAQQLHGPSAFADLENSERGLSGWFQAYVPNSRSGQGANVGAPFRVAEERRA